MSFTKVTNTGIGSTGTVLLQNLDVIGIVTAGFGVSTVDVFTTGVSTFSGVTNITNTTDSTSSTTGALIVTGGVGIAASLNVGGSVSVGGTLTYEDVTNVDSVGIITARSNILVGSGITLSPDGDVFTTGVSTFSSNVNIGVGTTGSVSITPDAAIKLSVVGTSEQDVIHISTGNAAGNTFANIRGDNEAGIRIRGGGSFDGGAIELGGGLRNTDPGIIKFETGTGGTVSERARITKNGKVGIGTDEPIGLLHLTTTNGDCELILESDTDNDNEYDNPRIIFRQDGHGSQSSIGIGGTTNDSSIHNALTFKNSCTSAGGIIFMTNNVNGSLVPYQNHLEAVERLRIHSSGAFGLSGTNYGSDNQALTSQGSSSPPEWRGINSPAWDSDATSTVNVPNVTWTLVGGLGENFDSDGAFASSTFTVPAGGAGTYFIYGVATIDDIQADDFVLSGIVVNAGSNGNEPINSRRGSFGCSGGANERVSSVVNIITTLAVGDQVRLAVYHNEGSTEPTEPYYTRFGGFRLSI